MEEGGRGGREREGGGREREGGGREREIEEHVERYSKAPSPCTVIESKNTKLFYTHAHTHHDMQTYTHVHTQRHNTHTHNTQHTLQST